MSSEDGEDATTLLAEESGLLIIPGPFTLRLPLTPRRPMVFGLSPWLMNCPLRNLLSRSVEQRALGFQRVLTFPVRSSRVPLDGVPLVARELSYAHIRSVSLDVIARLVALPAPIP